MRARRTGSGGHAHTAVHVRVEGTVLRDLEHACLQRVASSVRKRAAIAYVGESDGGEGTGGGGWRSVRFVALERGGGVSPLEL